MGELREGGAVVSGRIPSEGAWQMLADLAPTADRAARNRAATKLDGLVRRLVQFNLPAVLRHQEDDVHATILELVIRRYPAGFVEDSRENLAGRDNLTVGYVRSMVINYGYDLLRKRKATHERKHVPYEEIHERAEVDESGTPSDGSDLPWGPKRHDLASPEPGLEGSPVRAVLPIVQRVVEAAAEARHPRYRDDLHKTWSLLCEIACDERPIREIVARDEGIGEDAPQPVLVAARNRIYKRCSRLRVDLLSVADTLQIGGHLTGEEHRLVVAFVTGVAIRCQGPKPASVRGG